MERCETGCLAVPSIRTSEVIKSRITSMILGVVAGSASTGLCWFE